MKPLPKNDPLRRAIEIAGSQAELARLIGVPKTTINRMVRVGRASWPQCKAIEEATGVPRAELRPDVYL